MQSNREVAEKRICVCSALEAADALVRLTDNLAKKAFDDVQPDPYTTIKRDLGSAKIALETVENTCGVSLNNAKHEVEIALGLFNDSQYTAAWDHSFNAKKMLREDFCT